MAPVVEKTSLKFLELTSKCQSMVYYHSNSMNSESKLQHERITNEADLRFVLGDPVMLMLRER